MVSEGDLFNTSPGCDLTGSGSDPANQNCGTDPVAPADAQVNTLNSGENGFSQADENPYNDFTVQAPAVGSGAGVNQLNSSAGFQPDYARSSANPAGSNGTAAQNYEAYAVDGISWTAFKSKGTTLYPADYVHTLTPGPAHANLGRHCPGVPQDGQWCVQGHRRQQLGLPHDGDGDLGRVHRGEQADRLLHPAVRIRNRRHLGRRLRLQQDGDHRWVLERCSRGWPGG